MRVKKDKDFLKRQMANIGTGGETFIKVKPGVGLARNSTFSKVIKDLTRFSFIDPVDRGGLRGFRKGYNRFKLSCRWESYGTAEFWEMDWETFVPEL
jgi:hypothetical protein